MCQLQDLIASSIVGKRRRASRRSVPAQLIRCVVTVRGKPATVTLNQAIANGVIRVSRYEVGRAFTELSRQLINSVIRPCDSAGISFKHSDAVANLVVGIVEGTYSWFHRLLGWQAG